MTKTYFRGARKMGYSESLYFCGCDSCLNEIKSNLSRGIPVQTGFREYVAERYPKTAAALES